MVEPHACEKLLTKSSCDPYELLLVSACAKYSSFFPDFFLGSPGEICCAKWEHDAWVFLRDVAKTDFHGFMACVCALLDLLNALHSAGIVHQDAKLNNFLVKEAASGECTAGRITFTCKGTTYMVACCDIETLFLFYSPGLDKYYNVSIAEKKWWGFRRASETRAHFDNVKSADTHTLVCTIRMLTKIYFKDEGALDKCLKNALHMQTTHVLVDVRRGQRRQQYDIYVPNRTLCTAAQPAAVCQTLRMLFFSRA